MFAGVTLIVGSMKIEGGTGGPARLIALVDTDEVNSAHHLGNNQLLIVLTAVLSILGKYISSDSI